MWSCCQHTPSLAFVLCKSDCSAVTLSNRRQGYCKVPLSCHCTVVEYFPFENSLLRTSFSIIGPYSAGIRPKNWLRDLSIDDNLAKLTGGCPCNGLACASNPRSCKSVPRYGITSISLKWSVEISRRTTIGKVRTPSRTGPESLFSLKSSFARC